MTAIDRCPECDTRTQPQRGHPSLCLPCTETEIGTTVAALRERATERIQGAARKKWRVTS